MVESHREAPAPSRFGVRNTMGGEIVEVQGGHIVRSTGKKDRHSKVCTSKGPRDRRIRLSAHTAIQFYDVQDRLGYDRPSKAVDWLMKKAKAAIDELDELPPWNPASITATSVTITKPTAPPNNQVNEESEYKFSMDDNLIPASAQHDLQPNVGGDVQMAEHPKKSSSFLPPSLHGDAIADTIKSFFPMEASADQSTSSSVHFQNYPADLISRTMGHSHTEDLKLSLHSQQDPVHLHVPHDHNQHENEQQLLVFSGHDLGFDGGIIFNPPLPQPTVSPSLTLFGQNQYFSQRGPLQSSYTPLVRAWIDPTDHHHQVSRIYEPFSNSSLGFTCSTGEFSGFRVPARIQGEEEEHNCVLFKPSSSSSDSRH